MKQRVKEMEAEAAKIMEMNEEATKIDTTENAEGKFNIILYLLNNVIFIY